MNQLTCHLDAWVSRSREIIAGHWHALGVGHSNPRWFNEGSLDCDQVLASDLGGSACTGIREGCTHLLTRTGGERQPLDRGVKLSLLHCKSASDSTFIQSAIEMSAMLIFRAVRNHPIHLYHWFGPVGLHFAPVDPDIADYATRRFANRSA